jgi:hypothetical protein
VASERRLETLSLSKPMWSMLFLSAAMPLGPEPSLSAELRERLRTRSFSVRMSPSRSAICRSFSEML